jgi:putative ABC transport system permease protein
MMPLVRLAMLSAWNRRFTLGLMLIAVALSTTLLLGIDRVRHEVRNGFTQSVSGTDLVVGARTSPVQLMLYAIFRLGGATNNISWSSAQKLSSNPAVAWTIPLSLGDSHRGFPVLATNDNYFKFFHYGDRRALRFAEGRHFQTVFETVLGSEVAERLHYKIGDRIVLSHGTSEMNLSDHADKPFTVIGILARTGTPVDKTAHISLEAMEAIHLDWEGGAPLPGMTIPPELVKKFDLTPKTVTAVLVGLKSRAGVFALQREIANEKSEPLMAVLPGVALDELWQVVGIGEKALLAVSAMVMAVGLAGLASSILASLGERRRELAVLRSVGARPADIFFLLSIEGFFVMLTGVLLGVVLLTASFFIFGPFLETRFGVAFRVTLPTIAEFQSLLWIVGAGFAVSLLPGFRAYRVSLSDGLSPRI